MGAIESAARSDPTHRTKGAAAVAIHRCVAVIHPTVVLVALVVVLVPHIKLKR